MQHKAKYLSITGYLTILTSTILLLTSCAGDSTSYDSKQPHGYNTNDKLEQRLVIASNDKKNTEYGMKLFRIETSTKKMPSTILFGEVNDLSKEKYLTIKYPMKQGSDRDFSRKGIEPILDGEINIPRDGSGYSYVDRTIAQYYSGDSLEKFENPDLYIKQRRNEDYYESKAYLSFALFDYVATGYLRALNEHGFENISTVYPFLIVSKPTPINNMPTSGKVYYDARAVQGAPGKMQDIEVDFANKTVKGNPAPLEDLGHAGLHFYAQIHGNKFYSERPDKMFVEGGFYGPHAENIAGRFESHHNHPGESNHIHVGTFIGQKKKDN